MLSLFSLLKPLIKINYTKSNVLMIKWLQVYLYHYNNDLDSKSNRKTKTDINNSVIFRLVCIEKLHIPLHSDKYVDFKLADAIVNFNYRDIEREFHEMRRKTVSRV